MITGRFRLIAGIDNPRIRLEITSQWQASNLTWLIDYSVTAAAYLRQPRLPPVFESSSSSSCSTCELHRHSSCDETYKTLSQQGSGLNVCLAWLIAVVSPSERPCFAAYKERVRLQPGYRLSLPALPLNIPSE